MSKRVGAAIASAAMDAAPQARAEELTAWFAEPRVDTGTDFPPRDPQYPKARFVSFGQGAHLA